MQLEKKVYTVEETAQLLEIGLATAYQGVKTGDIPCIKIGGRILVPVSALEQKLLSANEQPE